MPTPVTIYSDKIDVTLTFRRTTCRKWFDIRETSYVPIFEDWDFVWFMTDHYKKTNFNHAKMYMSLFGLFGPHNSYDDYKCSYQYRLLIDVEQGDKKYKYALMLTDIKGNMPYFHYYRSPKEGEESGIYRPPNDEELSKEDLRFCTINLVSYLQRFFDARRPFFNQPFFRINPAGYVIYGFENGDFFETYHSYSEEGDYEKFEAEIKKYQAKPELNTPMSKPFWEEEEVNAFFS